nr:oxidoreductase [Staphylococcus epidermidis]
MLYQLPTLPILSPFPLIQPQNKINHLNQAHQLKIHFHCTHPTQPLPNSPTENAYPVTNYHQLHHPSSTITIQKP